MSRSNVTGMNIAPSTSATVTAARKRAERTTIATMKSDIVAIDSAYSRMYPKRNKQPSVATTSNTIWRRDSARSNSASASAMQALVAQTVESRIAAELHSTCDGNSATIPPAATAHDTGRNSRARRAVAVAVIAPNTTATSWARK